MRGSDGLSHQLKVKACCIARGSAAKKPRAYCHATRLHRIAERLHVLEQKKPPPDAQPAGFCPLEQGAGLTLLVRLLQQQHSQRSTAAGSLAQGTQPSRTRIESHRAGRLAARSRRSGHYFDRAVPLSTNRSARPRSPPRSTNRSPIRDVLSAIAPCRASRCPAWSISGRRRGGSMITLSVVA